MTIPVVNPAGVRVVSFDLWLTLIRSNSTPNKATRGKALYDILRPAGVTLEEFMVVVKAAEKWADKLSETTPVHYGPYARTQYVTDHYGLPMLNDETFAAYYAAQGKRFMEYLPELMQGDLPKVLAQLAERYTLACISNTGFVNGAEMRPALEAIGILDAFTIQLFSDEVGANKPHPKIFQALLDQSGVRPDQVVHIGDNFSADYEGARAFGMQAIHLPAEMTVAEATAVLL